MPRPNPHFDADSPIQVVSSQALFADHPAKTHKAASLIRIERTGRLFLGWRISMLTEQKNEGSVALSRSDDDGETWSTPEIVFERKGWHCMLMGGLNRITDDRIRMIVGGVKLDFSLGGPEPFTETFQWPIDSHDGGVTWGAPGEPIDLFPLWTEMYGASNPHSLSDGRLMWAAIGTVGRDDQWHAGVTFTDANGAGYTQPVVFAYDPARNYADTDVVRLPDGRYLAVIRELTYKDSFYCLSSDEGKTWTPMRPTGFKGANIKLFALRSGGVLCAYRNEDDPANRGVACSITHDGGETWREIGWLYRADPTAKHSPSYLCGYPDMVYVGDREILATLHTYPDEAGRIDLHAADLLHAVRLREG